MGRHLAFWKYEKDISLHHQDVYLNLCCDGNSVEGLAKLPIKDILRQITDTFSDYEQLDETSYKNSQSAFSFFTTKQSVLFDCGWSMPESDLNRIIDVMLTFGCPLYDPQIETRFDTE